ncbi:MAG: peptide/nickel transport system ATP-binding protein ddpF [Gaiellales bacterium]|jgi:peptide/nickel transport system ATP-binding protein|nr:peptide/nickel transport system ATP-binding protein ddpF [Gaiellales bacterium]
MSVVEPSIVVENLRIVLRSTGEDIVDDVSFSIAPGEVLGLVGESGSGKTTAGLALLGHTRRGAVIAGGSIRIGDADVLALGREQQRRLRGGVISYVPQDPAASLNPALRIGTQLMETLEEHDFGRNGDERRQRVAEMMREVALPDEPKYLRRYPHELSGGQQQRIGLAMAFACRPRVIVLDEPTTGLDVTTQAHVLDTVRQLASLHGTAALYVSHDLAVVATLATRVAVMYAGRVVEMGPTEELFHAAGHPYTRRLIEAIPHLSGKRQLVGIPGRAPSPGSRPYGCFFAPRCTWVIDACRTDMPPLRPVATAHNVRCIRAEEVRVSTQVLAGELADIQTNGATADSVLALDRVCASYAGRQVLHDITIALEPKECLALVGESGSGKTTLARSIAGLHRERTGEILLSGKPVAESARGRSVEERRSVQYIFQNPYGSLNPRRSIGQIIRQPLDIFGVDDREADRRAVEMLDRVSLPESYMDKYPDQLSGGERQRVAIARALVANPAVLVCDEVTSALDVSVQAAIVELLAELQRELGLAMLFVTHNLPLVRSIAQRVAVMSEGRIVEMGGVERVLNQPSDNYTKALLADTPSLESARA